jgi:D-aminoacyl-tRNA deacylase
MRAVIQRVSRARVIVDGSVAGEIADGLVVLVGVGRDDTFVVSTAMAEKIANLRIFEDDERKMNRSLLDVKGSALVISQFTLYGDARGQRRPSFVGAAPAEEAERRRSKIAAAHLY